jgi:tellurite resistance protein TehA-like permease
MKLKPLRWIPYFFIVLALLFFVAALPAVIPHTLTSSQKQNNVATNNERAQTVSVPMIFANNFLLSSFSLFPVAGWIFISIVMFKTGLIVASYSQPWYWLTNNVFMWIELAVYSFAILQSIRVLKLVWYRQKTVKPWNQIASITAFTLSISGLIILFSAIYEYVVIIRNCTI